MSLRELLILVLEDVAQQSIAGRLCGIQRCRLFKASFGFRRFTSDQRQNPHIQV
jgi:hypothetical protein